MRVYWNGRTVLGQILLSYRNLIFVKFPKTHELRWILLGEFEIGYYTALIFDGVS